MSNAIENLMAAQERAMKGRPKVGGFPYLAEVLRCAGITKNIWFLPSCQSLYFTKDGPVVIQGSPLITGAFDVPSFNSDALIHAIRADQTGKSTFPEFLLASWNAGIVRYIVDFIDRKVAYYGCFDEEYVEHYQTIELDN